ncbi:MAG TPA: Pathogenesis-related transcriptional factor and ERF protein [Saprospiraceae bacterium]|nr:Pathogenesis-related transcriptional factor and ERF protein [Saprospiraceae bacterium]
MNYKVKLKNSDDVAIFDEIVYEFLTTDPYLVKIDFVRNIRRHSSGCGVFQKVWKNPDGSYVTETIYLHKLIAEKFLGHLKTKEENLVGAVNGNKLDCRLENLTYRSRAQASRQRKTTSHTGYTGVYKEGVRYRAVISIDGKSSHIGMFSSAEEAAVAYNAMSRKLYGKKGKINKVKWMKNSPK